MMYSSELFALLNMQQNVIHDSKSFGYKLIVIPLVVLFVVFVGLFCFPRCPFPFPPQQIEGYLGVMLSLFM